MAAMKYPESVLTRNRKGGVEVRRLLSRGSFVKYDYILADSGRVSEGGKFSVILKSDDGKDEHYFMIPVAGGRWMAIPEKGAKERKVWNEKTDKAEDA
ncbi:MAG: hypothetical protein FJY76_04165 [Candidatus Aenigmarchaeota archaeon]|nr:hypothetical protein [Candidatus Aenigmarchaeota archaeon]